MSDDTQKCFQRNTDRVEKEIPKKKIVSLFTIGENEQINLRPGVVDCQFSPQLASSAVCKHHCLVRHLWRR